VGYRRRQYVSEQCCKEPPGLLEERDVCAILERDKLLARGTETIEVDSRGTVRSVKVVPPHMNTTGRLKRRGSLAG
jgi:hypothetical protein